MAWMLGAAEDFDTDAAPFTIVDEIGYDLGKTGDIHVLDTLDSAEVGYERR